METHFDNDLLDMTEYEHDIIFQSVFKFIETTLAENPAIEKNELYTKIFEQFSSDSDGRACIDFHQANVLDNHFFHTGENQYWREPYGFPLDGDVVFSSTDCSVGIFTFKKTSV